MRSAARVMRWIASLLLLAVAVGAWLLMAPTQLGGQFRYAVVHGESMLPVIQDGDLLVVSHQDSYRNGDVVLFRMYGGWIVHRLVGGDLNAGWTTQGTNAASPDSWVLRDERIVGRYVMHSHALGVLANVVATHRLLALVALALLGVLLYLPLLLRAGRGAERATPDDPAASSSAVPPVAESSCGEYLVRLRTGDVHRVRADVVVPGERWVLLTRNGVLIMLVPVGELLSIVRSSAVVASSTESPR